MAPDNQPDLLTLNLKRSRLSSGNKWIPQLGSKRKVAVNIKDTFESEKRLVSGSFLWSLKYILRFLTVVRGKIEVYSIEIYILWNCKQEQI